MRYRQSSSPGGPHGKKNKADISQFFYICVTDRHSNIVMLQYGSSPRSIVCIPEWVQTASEAAQVDSGNSSDLGSHPLP